MALVGAGAYLALLNVMYGSLQNSYIPPQWWRNLLRPRLVASAAWFVLINAAGAIFAALPVAFGVVLFAKARRLVLGLLIGVLPCLYFMGSGVATYGLPTYAVAWVIVVFQFLSISLAVPLAVVLFSIGPLTTRSSGP